MNVVIGTPIHCQGTYVIDKFLSNQKQIQQDYTSSELILATSEYDFTKKLENAVSLWELRATVLFYDVAKPSYARSPIWNITAGRETIRKYMLSQTEARYLLFLDSDMTFEPSVIETLERKIRDCDVVFSGYPLKCHGIGLAGAGCLMLSRNILERIQFRCYEFQNGEVIFEDNLLEMDLFRLGSRVKKGFFLSISHYTSARDARHITPQPVSMIRRMLNCSLIRYGLIRASITIHRNIPWNLKLFLIRLKAFVRKQVRADDN